MKKDVKLWNKQGQGLSKEEIELLVRALDTAISSHYYTMRQVNLSEGEVKEIERMEKLKKELREYRGVL